MERRGKVIFLELTTMFLDLSELDPGPGPIFLNAFKESTWL